MNRSNITLIVLLGLIALAIWWLRQPQDAGTQVWHPTYDYEYGEMPYDVDVLFELLKHDIGDESFVRIEEAFSEVVDPKNEGLYLGLQQSFTPDSLQTTAIINYVKSGSTAFIAAEYFGEILIGAALNNGQDSGLCSASNTFSRVLTKSIDTVRFRLTNNASEFVPRVFNNTGYWEPFRFMSFNCVQQGIIKTLGFANDNEPVLIRINLGKGQMYLMSSPVVFTNYVMRDSMAFLYAKEIFSHITFDYVYWDELKFDIVLDDENDTRMSDVAESPFKHIFTNRSLKLAFFLIIIGSFFFIMIATRRTRPSIPIFRQPINSTVAFSKTIARLYWLNPNHKKIAEKRFKFFLGEVRKRYQLDTTNIDDEFRQNLQRKSAIDIRQINRLFDAYSVVKKSSSIHEDLLMQISNSIAYIRQYWK